MRLIFNITVQILSVFLLNNSLFAQGYSYATPIELNTSRGRSITTADLNKDNAPDIISGTMSPNQVQIFLNNGSGGFNTEADYLYPASIRPDAVTIADINEDTHLDIIMAGYGDSSLCIFWGSGDGSFYKQDTLKITHEKAVDVAPAHLNSDSLLDLAVITQDNARLLVFISKGNGTFELPLEYTTTGDPNDLKIADFDNDLDLDVAVGHGGGSYFYIHYNDGAGDFSTKVQQSAPAGPPTFLDVGFMNDDLFWDIVTVKGGMTEGTLDILLNDQSGNVSESAVATPGEYMRGIYLAQIDSGGLMDIVSVNKDGLYISIGNGTGGIFNTDTLATYDSNSAERLCVDDLNMDGRNDIIVRNKNSINIYIENSIISSSNMIVDSDVTSNTTWVADTVFVVNNINISNGVILTIQEGTKVLFSDHYKLTVLGAINALGAEGDSILFSALDTTGFWDDYSQNTGSWSGIEYPEGSVQTDSSYFAYCIFQYAKATEVDDIHDGAVFNVIDASRIKIENSTFQNNTAYNAGGAIYAKNVDIALSNTRFIKNYSYRSSGGALFFSSYSEINIEDCYFENNNAYKGGAVFVLDIAEINVNNCDFYNNSATKMSGRITDQYGAAISIYRYLLSDPMYATITNNKIIGSRATIGAVYFEEGVEVLIENNTFAYNWAGNTSAAIGNGKDCNLTIKNNLFTNNEANSGAAIYYNFNGIGLKLINNLFANNYGSDASATLYGNGGGAVSITNTVSPIEIINNTFVNNRHNYMGGALHLASKNAKIINNIFHNNSAPNAPQIALNTKGANNDSLMYPNLKYNCIQDGPDSIGVYRDYSVVEYDSLYRGIYENNISDNPLFVQPSLGIGLDFDGLDADWSLTENSWCINMGNPSFSADSIGVELDLAGNPRVYLDSGSQIVDIGAYEFQGIPTGLEDFKNTPQSSTLFQNYPNPFNPITNISYEISKSSKVNLSVYDLLGRKIATLVNKYMTAGTYNVQFDASLLSSGVYLYKIRTGKYSSFKKMILMK